MRLLIGKNSKLVGALSSKLFDFDFISHTEISQTDLRKYETIFLFSWSHNSLAENLEVIAQLPLHKTVFISTMAVLALAVRPQYARYPRDKLHVEKQVIAAGGSVLRIGVTDPEMVNRVTSCLPFTSTASLVEAIQGAPREGLSSVYTLISGRGKVASWRRRAAKAVDAIHGIRVMRNVPALRVPLDVALKLCGDVPYGYTADLLRLFPQKMQIGFGALGSRHWSQRPHIERPTVVVSPEEDLLLSDRGFRGTRVGKKMNGLSKFWHGARVVEHQGQFLKRVPILIRRKAPPLDALSVEVEAIYFDKGAFSIRFASDVGGVEGGCRQLVLAAGALENCRLLGDMLNIETTLSDQEVGCIGTISTEEAVNMGMVSCALGLCIRRRMLVRDSHEICVDVRPYSKKYQPDMQFYNQKSSGVIWSILKRFSASILNEAIFNKFGIACATKRMLVVAQLLSEDCVVMRGGLYSRKRLTSEELAARTEWLKSEFNSFQEDYAIDMVDAIHYQGGRSICGSETFRELLKSNMLTVLGSPTDKALGSVHNTWDQIEANQVL